jgi:lysophospholipase L1-like esterase
MTILQAAGTDCLGSTSLVKRCRLDPAPAFELSSRMTEPLTVLFQGDSITDAGRDRTCAEPNAAAALGQGYTFMAAARLLRDQPEGGLRCLNRGVSGDQVPHLLERWQSDTLELRPNVLSILIGVNDLWHRLDHRSSGTVESYATEYRRLLEWTRRELPHCKLLICEPFVLRCGAVDDRWFPEFDERRGVVRRLAQSMADGFVAFQDVFDAAVTGGPEPACWADDGVHPTVAGHALMADAWLEQYAALG